MTTRPTTLVARFGAVLLAGVFGLTLGACLEDGTSDLRQEHTCSDYCATAKACDDEVDEDECVADCLDAMGSCMADEQEASLDRLDECAAESCDDFAGCTIDAGAQCYFGI